MFAKVIFTWPASTGLRFKPSNTKPVTLSFIQQVAKFEECFMEFAAHTYVLPWKEWHRRIFRRLKELCFKKKNYKGKRAPFLSNVFLIKHWSQVFRFVTNRTKRIYLKMGLIPLGLIIQNGCDSIPVSICLPSYGNKTSLPSIHVHWYKSRLTPSSKHWKTCTHLMCADTQTPQ